MLPIIIISSICPRTFIVLLFKAVLCSLVYGVLSSLMKGGPIPSYSQLTFTVLIRTVIACLFYIFNINYVQFLSITSICYITNSQPHIPQTGNSSNYILPQNGDVIDDSMPVTHETCFTDTRNSHLSQDELVRLRERLRLESLRLSRLIKRYDVNEAGHEQLVERYLNSECKRLNTV